VNTRPRACLSLSFSSQLSQSHYRLIEFVPLRSDEDISSGPVAFRPNACITPAHSLLQGTVLYLLVCNLNEAYRTETISEHSSGVIHLIQIPAACYYVRIVRVLVVRVLLIPSGNGQQRPEPQQGPPLQLARPAAGAASGRADSLTLPAGTSLNSSCLWMDACSS
jgi:hypothetical protein